MRSKWIAAAAAACAATFATSAGAQHGPGWFQGWRVIGQKVVNGGSDTDNIYTPGAVRYRQLRVCAFNAPLGMRDMDVYFANGGHQDVATRDILRPGTCTRVIDLNGHARDIARIRLKYGRLARGFQAPLVRVTAR
jgi:hypothetical protein